MRYIKTTAGTPFPREALTNWKVRLAYKVFFFIPKSNPDNEPLYPDVDLWLLELNEENIPTREVGLDNEGEPIVSAPDRVNYGFFVDRGEPFLRDGEIVAKSDIIDRDYFEECWVATPKKAHQLG